MATFTQHAQQLLDAALASPVDTKMSVLIGPDGSIQLCADSDWSLESLARERGARAAYRVTRQGSKVRVEGRQGSQRCLLESHLARDVARELLQFAPPG